MRFCFNLVAGSLAEKYYMEYIVPKLKGDHSVRLGEMWGIYSSSGKPINQYTIGIIDRFRVRKEIRILKGK